MKEVKVFVKDKTLLELAEDASKGDLIDLKKVIEVDTTSLETAIALAKDKLYEEKFQELKTRLEAENSLKIKEMEMKLEALKKDAQMHENDVVSDIEEMYRGRIESLNQRIAELAAIQKSEVEKALAEQKVAFEKEKQSANLQLAQLQSKYENLQAQKANDIKNATLEVQNKFTQELGDVKLENEKALTALRNEKDEIIAGLRREKAALNVKQTGEDLESWCNNEVTSYMQNGLFNCTWNKDNEVIRDEDESKGSKADFIFRIYATEEHIETEELSSICMDMKDENPTSQDRNKKSNSDYFKQLDKNRNKKNCVYAVLVSNLETDKPNDIPMYKVREYENMYVVRPAYLMVFLNMITSLTTKFANAILAKEAEQLEFKDKQEILDEFAEIKNTYLDKPLETLEKQITEIKNSSDAITKANDKIVEAVHKIQSSYVDEIANKISKFELKLNRDLKKID